MRGGGYHGATTCARTAALGLLALAACVPTADLALPEAPAGTQTTILAFFDPDTGAVRSAEVLPPGGALAWSFPRRNRLGLYHYLEAPNALGLSVGPVELPQPNGSFLVLREPAARYVADLEAGGTAEWIAVTTVELPPLRVAAVGSDDCAKQRGCYVDDQCVPVCPDPSLIDAPAPPTAPNLPRETSCPAGWQPRIAPEVDAAVCEPGALMDNCPEGQFAFLGAADCQAVGPSCPPGDFADDPAPGRVVLYVKPDAVGGDGTRARPFGRIADALLQARPGTTIALARGTFEESVVMRGHDDVELRGACVAGTTLRSPTAGLHTFTQADGDDLALSDLRIEAPMDAVNVLTVGGTLRLRDVWIEGGIGGVVVTTGTVTIDHSVVRGQRSLPSGYGLQATLGGVLRATDVSLDGAGAWGVLASHGGRAEVHRAAIRRAPQLGMLALGDARIDAEEVLVDRPTIGGVWARAHGRVDLDRVVVRDGGPEIVTADGGGGLTVTSTSQALVRRSIFDGNADRNVWVAYASSATITDSLVLRAPKLGPAESIRAESAHLRLERTAIVAFGTMAIGAPFTRLTVRDAAIFGCATVEAVACGFGVVGFMGSIDLERVVVRKVGSHAVEAKTMTSMRLVDLDIQGVTRAGSIERLEAAVKLDATGPTELRRIRVEDSTSGAIYAQYPTTVVDLEDLYVDGAVGDGLILDAGAALTAKRIELHHIAGPGVAIIGAVVPPFTEATIAHITVDGITELGYPPSAGIACVLRTHSRITNFRVSHSEARGLFVGQESVQLEDGEVTSSPIGLHVLGDVDSLPLLRHVRIGADVTTPISREE